MTPAGESLAALRETEYVARLEATRLRRILYEATDPASAGDELFAELAEAERTLAAAEEARRAAQGADKSAGVIVDTTTDNQLLGARTTGLEVEVQLRMEHLPTAVAHLMTASDHPLVCCEIHNVNDDVRRLRVTSFVDGYAARAVDTVELDAQERRAVSQLPVVYAARAREVTELTRATLNVLVEDLDAGEKGVELHRSVPVWLLGRNSAPLAIQDPATGEWRDMTPYFAAFVTPNAPELMGFLRKAAERHPDKQLVGYQGDKSGVEPQVQAIFEALKADAHIAYVNSVLTSSPEEGFADQRVRLPRESISEGQGNCIDGTVLYASLVEAISMNPAIVVVPGHAFFAWETWSGSDEWCYLETTMTGTHEFAEARRAGERTAAHYSAMGNGDGGLRRLPVRTLRTRDRITPME